MKIASFSRGGVAGYGVVRGDQVCDLASADAPDLIAALRAGPVADRSDAPVYAFSEIEWLPVVVNPAKIFCVGHNYEEHRLETNGPRAGHPPIFTRFANSLTPHDGPIVRPRVSTMLDYEGELAVIIGKRGRHIAEGDAMDHVAGFAPANDASLRDWQRHTAQFTPGKNFFATGGLGPWMVTPDEIADLPSVSVTTRLNGAVMQHAAVADMIFSIQAVIAYLSTFTPLEPGDVIMTGTPGGVGARRDPPVWMKAGDIVEVEIGHVGTLRNRIVDEDWASATA